MKKFFYIFALLLVNLAAFSQDAFDTEKLLTQKPNQLVNDYTNTLTRDQTQALERKLIIFNDSTSTQIAVVIVPTLNGNDISDYGVKLGRAWGIGGKEFSNGVLLLIDLGKGERKLRIETGYGVEGALPDITAKHIIDDVIVPNFKGEDYYRGIEEGTDAIMQAVKGEYTAPKSYGKKSTGSSRYMFLIILIILFLLFSGGKGGKGGSFMSRRGAMPFILGSLLGSGGRGGGFGGGGGSSGGFGGFGGGGFGGGGASGSW